jgi:hypothetical protein
MIFWKNPGKFFAFLSQFDILNTAIRSEIF